ncbi:MAG: acyltransferase [Desulfobacteraceae bacterium]|nr:acyltransferase [Desulfobacteraceae bacterium]
MRRAIRRALRSVKAVMLSGIVCLAGRSYVWRRFCHFARIFGAVQVLRTLGAHVGDRCRIAWDIRIQNAPKGNCERLRIGDHVYIGPQCLFDLAAAVHVGDDVTLSARVAIVTHADVGDRPLQEVFARREGAVVVSRGAWIGVNATILHGVTVGACSVVGAMSLVRRDVPEGGVVAGVPARFLKWVKNVEQSRDKGEAGASGKESS